MSEQAQYRVKRGQIRLPRGSSKRVFVNHGDFVHQGDLLPQGVFDAADIKSWLADGRIERVDVSAEDAERQSAEITARSKWSVNPAALVGKSLEDLIVMVSEIDPEYDTDELVDEAAAVTLLTSGWDPRFAEETAAPKATDRTEVKNLKLDQSAEGPSTSSREREMSPAASDALASAREKAASAEAEGSES